MGVSSGDIDWQAVFTALGDDGRALDPAAPAPDVAHQAGGSNHNSNIHKSSNGNSNGNGNVNANSNANMGGIGLWDHIPDHLVAAHASSNNNSPTQSSALPSPSLATTAAALGYGQGPHPSPDSTGHRPGTISDEDFFAHFTHSFRPPPTSHPLYPHSGPSAPGPSSGHYSDSPLTWGHPPPAPRSQTAAASELNGRANLSFPTSLSRQNSSTTTSAAPSPQWSSNAHGGSSDLQYRPPPYRGSASTAVSILSVSTAATPSTSPTPNSEDTEDKRVRNTQASARFRAKKKQHVETIQRNIKDLETQHGELEREVDDLRKENGLLKEMVQLKYGSQQ